MYNVQCIMYTHYTTCNVECGIRYDIVYNNFRLFTFECTRIKRKAKFENTKLRNEKTHSHLISIPCKLLEKKRKCFQRSLFLSSNSLAAIMVRSPGSYIL